MTIKPWIIVSILFALTIAAACAPSRQVGGSPTSDMMDPDSTLAAPHPFCPVNTLHLDLSEAATVDLRVFDVTGQCVRRLLDGVRLPAGGRDVSWDKRDDAGRLLPTGLYFVLIESEGRREVRKMLIN